MARYSWRRYAEPAAYAGLFVLVFGSVTVFHPKSDHSTPVLVGVTGPQADSAAQKSSTAIEIPLPQRQAPRASAKARIEGSCGGPHSVKLSASVSATSCEYVWQRQVDIRRGAASPAKLPLLVSITSPVQATKMRQLRRKHWLAPHSGHFQYMFFVGLTDDVMEQMAVQHEMETHGDIVQLNVLDTFENLTIKSVAAATWSQKLHAAAVVLDGETAAVAAPWYWLKVEDYMNNSFAAIMEVVQQQMDGTHGDLPYYGGGSIFGGGKVMRQGRWGCPERHCPYERFPAKYAGGQYLLNSVAVSFVAAEGLAGLDVRDAYPIEDHYIAALLLAHSVDVQREKRAWWKGGEPYNPPWVLNRGGHNFLEYRWP